MDVLRTFACSTAIAVAASLPLPASAADPESVLPTQPFLVVDPGMHTAPITQVAAAQGVVATASQDKTIRLWSAETGDLERTIRLPAGRGDIGKAYAVAMSPDAGLIAAGGWTNALGEPEQVYIFGSSGTMVARIAGLTNSITSLAFSPDGQHLIALAGRGGVRVYDSAGWTEVEQDTGYRDASYGLAVASDGRFATSSYDGTLRLYTSEGKLSAIKGIGGRPHGLAFDPSGTQLAVGMLGEPKVSVVDGRSLLHLRDLDVSGIDNGDLSQLAWSSDGHTIWAGGKFADAEGVRILAWDADGSLPPQRIVAVRNTVSGLRSLPDGSLIVVGTDPMIGRVSPDVTRTWTNGPEQMNPRGQQAVLAASPDGMVIDFNIEAKGGQPARFDAGDLSLTRSPSADRRTAKPRQSGLDVRAWVNNVAPELAGQPLSLEPAEVARSLAIDAEGERFVVGADWSLRAFDGQGVEQWKRSVPGAAWAVNVPAGGRLVVVAYGDGTIRWHDMSNGTELLAFFPFRNGTDWVSWEPDGRYASTPGARDALRWVVNDGWDKAPLELRAGQIPMSYRPEVIRRILPEMGTVKAVYAAEEAGRRKAFRQLTGGIVPGAQLHVLAIGADYGALNAPARLKWAAADAANIAEALAGQSDWPYAPGYRITLRSEEATGVAILDQLTALRKRVALAPDERDLAVVMFSGHGLVLGEGDSEEFYLLPQDADIRTAARVRQSGISGTELRREILGIAEHGRVLLLLDTCSSGAITGQDRPASGAELQALFAGKDVTVFASSGADEVSRENDTWANGAFTETMLEALGRTADSDQNGMVSVGELTDFVSWRLPDLTDGRQTPTIESRLTGDIFASGSEGVLHAIGR
jgi:WD40 repeat protein